MAFALRQAEVPVAEVCRKMGVSEAAFLPVEKRSAGMGVLELRRPKWSEDEDAELERPAADPTPAETVPQDAPRRRR